MITTNHEAGGGADPSGISRRAFTKALIGGSALSLVALDRLSAAVYDSIDALNQQYLLDPSPDGAYWDALREHFMFQEGLIMMNNGTVGPMPEPVFNTLVKYFKVQCTQPCDVYNTFGSRVDGVRDKLAGFIGAAADEVVLTHNTTEGMNFVANGLDLEPGDEVLLSNMEHPGGTHPWNLKAARHGIEINEVPIGCPPESVGELIDAFERAITPRTKVISVSHTVFITGLIFPIKELSEMAHRHGVLVLADSAHGLGMLDLDMHGMGVDFFASSPYKWLGAPTGIGLLYVSKEAQEKLWPTIATSGWDTAGSASRYETLGQRADALAFALGEAIDFQNRVGKDRIERRIKTLASHLKEGLAEIPGARLHTSQDCYLSGGLTAFSVAGVDPQQIVDYLRERYNIVVRTIGNEAAGTRGVRVSTHVFVNLEQVDMVLEGVRHLASQV
jgi:selenocysteine lyase/cysteine desulfurase